MAQTVCHSLKSSLVAFLNDQTEVFAADNYCVVTLPLKTLDGRFIDIYVESNFNDVVRVHDGGKTTSELFSQGIHIGDETKALFKSLAARYGATFENGAFSIACWPHQGRWRQDTQAAILGIAQCATLAMFDLLRHVPVVEDQC